VTKGIGSGIFTLLSLGYGLNLFEFDQMTYIVGGFLALLFIAITTGLLVYDLERPERFLSILYRPQWRSWLTRGAYILVGFSALTTVWWLIELGAYFDVVSMGLAEWFRPYAMFFGLPLSVGVALYTAFLFGQAEGRDLWQSTLLPFHLFVQSLMAGSAALLAMDIILPLSDTMSQIIMATFVIMLSLVGLVTLFGEFGMPHASEVAAQAAHEISEGRYKDYFWGGSITMGHILPLLILALDMPALIIIAVIGAIGGLYAFEYAFVMAPQDVPNS